MKTTELLSRLLNLVIENNLSISDVSQKTGLSQNYIEGFFHNPSPNIEDILNIAQAIGYNLTFSRNFTEYQKTDNSPEFLMCPDPVANQLYILHRNEPVCLIHVVQSTPIRFVVQELYTEMDNPDDILNMPFVQRAKDFFFNKPDRVCGWS